MNLLVTGGSRGIGRAVVLGARTRGWDVTFSYASDAAAAEAVATTGARAVKADAASEEDTLRLFDEAEEMGPITGLVVNAGVIASGSKLADVPLERIRRMFEVNCVGAMLTAREGARRMAGGSMVILSSAAARLGSGGEFVDYAASKGAMDTLTTGLAKELAPKIRVNAIRPGIIETDMNDAGKQGGRADRLGPSAPLGRSGQPEEVANAILWLLSEESSYVIGAHLDVTGGR